MGKGSMPVNLAYTAVGQHCHFRIRASTTCALIITVAYHIQSACMLTCPRRLARLVEE